jgi:hypothetical protein
MSKYGQFHMVGLNLMKVGVVLFINPQWKQRYLEWDIVLNCP